MKNYFLSAIKITIITAVLFGVLYPLLIVGVSTVVAPNYGEGELVEANGKIVGFELIGQSFTTDQYFMSRPSAVDYNAAATGGSNKGTNNPDYLKVVDERIAGILSKNPGIEKKDVPVDLITASGGGLDPHISVDGALIQVKRIAKVRGLNENILKGLVLQNVEEPWLGIIGTKKINVLKLNIALDALTVKND